MCLFEYFKGLITSSSTIKLRTYESCFHQFFSVEKKIQIDWSDFFWNSKKFVFSVLRSEKIITNVGENFVENRIRKLIWWARSLGIKFEFKFKYILGSFHKLRKHIGVDRWFVKCLCKGSFVVKKCQNHFYVICESSLIGFLRFRCTNM